MRFKKILKQLIINNPDVDKELIEKAYKFAKKKLRNKKHHLTKKTFLNQALSIIEILLPLGIDNTTAVAILLYYTIVYSKTSFEEIRKNFGSEVVELLIKMRKYKECEVDSTAERVDERLLLADCKDLRVLLIKLVKSLSYLKCLKIPKENRKCFAKEALETRVPIIYKLGLYFLKNEFEDCIFKELDAESYRKIGREIKNLKIVKKLPVLKRTLENKLKEVGIPAKVYARRKHLYSIYQKMKKKNIEINEIHDIAGLRVITDTIEHCYEILGIVHSMWKPILNEFNDYIANPKENGYQSLHTALMSDDGMFEVQIRTKEMQIVAEYGVAAHWRYKGIKEYKDYEDLLKRLRKSITWNGLIQPKNIKELTKDVEEPIFVFTPKKDIVVLPNGATALDFAYAIHTSIGNKCKAAYVNNKLVSLDYKLKNADTVKIITAENQKPKRSWLNMVVTEKAKQQIRKLLAIKRRKKIGKKKEIVEIRDNKNVKIAKCCLPLPGDEVVAYKSKKRKLIIHKKNCINIEKLPKERLTDVDWKAKGSFLSEVKIEGEMAAISNILKIITENGNRLKGTHIRNLEDRCVVVFTLATKDKNLLENTIEEIRKVPGIISVERA